MSVDFDSSKHRWRVRWREEGRQRTRRFPTQAEAHAFAESLRVEVEPPGPARAIVERAGGDAIYAYSSGAGVRYRFAFRQSDGKLSTRRGFTSRRAAATARRRLVESIERGEVKAARETFETFWLRLLDERRAYMTQGSSEDFETHGRKRLLPSLGSTPLARIDEQIVRRWMDEMVGLVEAGDLAPKTVNNARTCLSVALNEAQRRGLLSRNPCAAVAALPVDRAELDYLRLDEIGRYLDACAPHYRPLASFLIGAGARISEALDVRFRHLDVEQSVVRIYRHEELRIPKRLFNGLLSIRHVGITYVIIIIMNTQLSAPTKTGQGSEVAVDGRGRRLRVLLISCMSLFIVGLDITAVNVALPAIGEDLDASLSGLQWTVSAYTVVMASLLLFSGSMADRLGRKRVFVTGLSVFSLASLLCSLAPTVELLIAFRVLQAVGGSMLNPVAMSIITNTFTDPRERAQAVGVWGAVFGVSMALGPIVGGALVSSAGWASIFLINIPLGLAAIILTFRFIPESRAPRARRFDPVGQVLVIVLLASVTYGIIEGPSAGWSSPAILTSFTASAMSLLALLLYEPRREEPLIDLRFFRSIPFSSSIALSAAAFAAFGGFLFLNTLYLQDVRALSPIGAGLATVPMALMTVLISPLSGRIVGRRGPRAPLMIAGVCLAVASWMLIDIAPTTPLASLIAAYVVFGIGFGFVNAPITNAAVSGMPRAQAGVASAIATTSRQFGQALGVAIVGAIIASSQGASAQLDLSSASRPAWWTLTAFGGVVLLLGFLATGGRAKESARRTAVKLNPEALAA